MTDKIDQERYEAYENTLLLLKSYFEQRMPLRGSDSAIYIDILAALEGLDVTYIGKKRRQDVAELRLMLGSYMWLDNLTDEQWAVINDDILPILLKHKEQRDHFSNRVGGGNEQPFTD